MNELVPTTQENKLPVRTGGSLVLSKDQESAMQAMTAWYNKIQAEGCNEKNQVFYLAGWAGTGKTTIADIFIKSLPKKHHILFGSFTGKAALRMRQVGMAGAQTLHSMIYKPQQKDHKVVFILDRSSVLGTADLLVLDECSMVDESLGTDVYSFGTPILILGDQGQLPPIRGAGYFTSRCPNATLTEVHRQALENPIVRLATEIRNGSTIRRYNEPELLTYAPAAALEEALFEFDQVLVGKNLTRNSVNDRFRNTMGFSGEYPNKEEKIICLRNNRELNLFNGMMGVMTEDTSPAEIYDEKGNPTGEFSDHLVLSFIDDMGDEHINILTHKEGFIDDTLFKGMDWKDLKSANQFTFGYAITVHKSQGSQWDGVVILDDNFLAWDKAERRKWLYTAVTRAADRLVIGKSNLVI